MTTTKPPSLSPRAKSLVRLLVMVEISLALHLAIIFGIQVGAVERGGAPSSPIEARLVPAASAKDEPQQQLLVKAIERPIESRVEEFKPPQTAPSAARTVPEEPHTPGMPAAAAGTTMIDAPLAADPTYYPLIDVDTRPARANNAKPIYPEKASDEDVKGYVKVLFLLSEDGTVDEATILKETPSGYGFGTAVNEWLRDARFNPSMRKGRAVKSRVVYEVTFDPNDNPQGGRK